MRWCCSLPLWRRVTQGRRSKRLSQWDISFALQDNTVLPDDWHASYLLTQSNPLNPFVADMSYIVYTAGQTQLFEFGFRQNAPGSWLMSSVTSVPEPSSIALLFAALAGLGFSKRKKS